MVPNLSCTSRIFWNCLYVAMPPLSPFGALVLQHDPQARNRATVIRVTFILADVEIDDHSTMNKRSMQTLVYSDSGLYLPIRCKRTIVEASAASNLESAPPMASRTAIALSAAISKQNMPAFCRTVTHG